ncbi:MAG TPA: ROK family transcriptional regulator [Bacillaceae bacterium]
MKIKTQDYLKKENQSLVLELILNQGPISRAEIAKQTMMSPTSASRIVGSLLELGLIKEISLAGNAVGRKATYFVPNGSSVISIGVEIDEKQIRIGFMDFLMECAVQRTFEYISMEPDETVKFIAEKIKQIKKDEGFTFQQIAGVCVGLPGLIQNESGFVKLSAQLNWKQVPLGEMLEKELGFPVFVDNELKLKALAEFNIDKVPEKETMAMITFGSGVGSALITKGEIYRGGGNFSGEVGHTIVDPYGIYCPCGNFGCLQTYIAEGFLLDEASKTKPVTCISQIIDDYEKGEKWATNIIDKAVTYATLTINNVVCMYNPDTVVLTGNLIERFPGFRERVFEHTVQKLWTPINNTFHLRTAKVGEMGVVHGAAMSVHQQFIKNITFSREF